MILFIGDILLRNWLVGLGLQSLAVFWVLFYLAVIALPSFVTVLLAGIVQSRRYRLVNGVLMIFIVAGLQFPGMIRMTDSLLGAAYAALQMGSALTGGVLALAVLRKSRTGTPRKKPDKEQVPEVPGETEPVPSRFLRVLAIASVPLVFVTVILSSLITIGFGLLLLFLLMQLPRVPVVLIAAGFLAPLAAVWASVKAVKNIFFPKPASALALIIQREQFPRLDGMIREVAARVGTKEPDHVILNAQTGFFVTQGALDCSGKVIKGRILSLGLPSLRNLSGLQLKSILAHEFAHFSGNDTAYSVLVAPVYRGIHSSIISLRNSGTGGNLGGAMAILQYPSVQYLIGFYEYFLTIDNMLSRNREMRADWIAAHIYGKDSFRTALEEVSVEMDLFGPALENVRLNSDTELFACIGLEEDRLDSRRGEILEKLNASSDHEFDSHPALRTRIDSLPDVATQENPDPAPLTEDLEALAEELSKITVARIKMPVGETASDE